MDILAQLRETLADFEQRGVRVVCIVQGTALEAEKFCGRHGVSGICIGDPDRTSYRSMGFERTSWWRILLGLPALRRSCSASLSGTLQKHSDVLQLPGVALMAQGGEIIWVHRGTHPGDLPSARELLAIIDTSNPHRVRRSASQPTVDGSA